MLKLGGKQTRIRWAHGVVWLTIALSYPRWGKARNTVTLVGRDKEFMDSLIPEVEKGVQGKRVSTEGEDDVEGESDKDT